MIPSEPSEAIEYALPLTKDGVLRLTVQLRERYLTPQTESGTALVQASGYALRIWVWSDRDNVLIEVPFDGFRSERVYQRKISNWGVNINKWKKPGKHVDGRHVGWWNDASVEVGYGGETGKPMVNAQVRTFEGEMPDV